MELQQPPEPELQARTDSIRTITTMLGCLLLKSTAAVNGPIACCTIEDEGFQVAVNEAKSMQATAYLKRTLFHEWRTSSSARGLQFGLNLGTFVECLRILTSGGRDALEKPATLRMEYTSATASLQLTLVEGPAVTECRMHTVEVDVHERIVMDDSVPARIVLKSDALREAIGELEWGGDASSQRDKRMTLRVGLSPAHLSFTVSSVDLGCEMVYPPESLAMFEAKQELEFDYRFMLLHMALRSLKESDEVQLKVAESGLLEFLLKFTCEGKFNFVDVRIYPLEEDEDGAAYEGASAE